MKYLMMAALVCFLCGCSKESDLPKVDETGNFETYYVAPNSIGSGDGLSEKDASDFLDDKLWANVQNQLSKQAVEVQFLAGDYKRAYTEKALVFNNFGNKDHRLTLKGNQNVIFTLPEGHRTKSYVIDFKGAQNITIDNFHFTGNGKINYVLRFTKSANEITPTTNILVQNCSWKDMGGVIYGATGCQFETTSNITYKNCDFRRIGLDGGSHMIYNAYSTDNIHIIDSHFEDCTGDYVRFRDDSDFGLVRNSTFIRTNDYPGSVFISVPLFNSRAPVGDEVFPTNFSFTKNKFVNNAFLNTPRAITFYNSGFSPPQWNYLLNKEEGQVLQHGSVAEKKDLLLNNFGIDADKVRIHGNTFTIRITNEVSLGTVPNYGAVSKGFSGWGNITDVVNDSNEPFSWEKE